MDLKVIFIATIGLMLSAPVLGKGNQRDGVVIVDGLNQEWGLTGSSPANSVQPHQVDAIDLRHMNFIYGSIYPSFAEFRANYTSPRWYRNEQGYRTTVHKPQADWQFAFAFDVIGTLFAGEAESTYELFFDVYPDREEGEVMATWHSFRPDYRFAFMGKNGRMEHERYQVWDGTRWVGEAVTDAPEVKAAARGNFFECLIPWSSLGNPLTRSATAPENGDQFMSFALRAHQGENQDFAPNPVWSQHWPYTGAYPIGNGQVDYESAISSRSWGQVKTQKIGD